MMVRLARLPISRGLEAHSAHLGGPLAGLLCDRATGSGDCGSVIVMSAVSCTSSS